MAELQLSEAEYTDYIEKVQFLSQNDAKVFVCFVNQTNRNVDLYWCDKSGVPNFYMRIVPAKHLNVLTYRSHPWIFRDYTTGEHLHVDNQKIYWPDSTQNKKEPQPECAVAISDQCLQVNIHWPMRSLFHSSLWALAEWVITYCNVVDVDAGKSAEIIEQLHMPKKLKEQLADVVERRSTYSQSVQTSDMYRLYWLPR